MADHTEESEPGRLLSRKTRPSVKPHGRFLDRWKELGGALAVAAAIVTGTVAVMGWAFSSRVEIVEAKQEKFDDDLDLMHQAQIKTITTLDHLHEEIRDARLDYRLLEKGKRLPDLEPEPSPTQRPTPSPTVTP